MTRLVRQKSKSLSTQSLPVLPHGWFSGSSSPPTAARESADKVYSNVWYKYNICGKLFDIVTPHFSSHFQLFISSSTPFHLFHYLFPLHIDSPFLSPPSPILCIKIFMESPWDRTGWPCYSFAVGSFPWMACFKAELAWFINYTVLRLVLRRS